MQKMIKALKEAQAVLTDYLAPVTPPQPGLNLYQETCLRLETSEKVINDLLKILDNRELVEEQRAWETINNNKMFTTAVRTLGCLGYTYSPGAEQWKPPHPSEEKGKPWSAQPIDAAKMACPDPNVEEVRKMLLDRSALGFKKYGTSTARNDLCLADWLQHLQEELCDAAVYVQAVKSGANPLAADIAKAREERDVNLAKVAALTNENKQLRHRLQRITDVLNGAK